MRKLTAVLLFAGALAAPAQKPVTLDNGSIRIELDPRTFSVRFLGTPGGASFVEPIHLSATEISRTGWLEPGGIVTDLLPMQDGDALLRRGPAEVVEHRPDYLLLLGPEHPELHWRIKKEFQLKVGAAELRHKTTVLSSRKEDRRAGLRITAQVPHGSELIVPRSEGEPGLLRGVFPDLAERLAGSGEHFRLRFTDFQSGNPVLLSIPASSLTLNNGAGSWARTVELESAVETNSSPSRVLIIADATSHTYQVALEVFQSGVNVGAPLVVVETWRINSVDAQVARN